MSKVVRIALAIPLLTSMLGCAALIVRDTDSVGAKTAKIATRTTLGVGTLGISEIAMAGAKKRDKQRQFHTFLNESIGRMTLDAAVMRWGVPVSRYDGEGMIVAQWGSESTSQVVVPVGNTLIARPVQHGWGLRLSFDSESKKLTTWSHDEW